MATFFTSDTHFGHANIIKLSSRPFQDCEAMDEALRDNWNAVVKPSDTVWHLGDFTWAKGEEAESYLKRLNGKINLIWGNHDSDAVRGWKRWHSSQFGTEIHLAGHRITLCHYAMRVWNKAHKGAPMLYGHSHDSLPGNSQSLDVGVDCWGMRPVTLDEILARMETLPRYKCEDHHFAATASRTQGGPEN
jgi:calcineurin-like phosphoesterase family protein